MTAQVSDTFVFRRGEYYVSAIEFPGNFINIYSLGFKPTAFHTACYRGYVATYSVFKKYLVLKNLYTNNGSDLKNEAPKLNNKYPKISIDKGLVEFTYKNINLIIPYTGSILITQDFIQEKYVHMGFQSPFNYNSVIQLTFNNGKYVISKDLSDIAKQIREKKLNIPEKDNDIRNMFEWINDSFDISYSSKVKGLLDSGRRKK